MSVASEVKEFAKEPNWLLFILLAVTVAYLYTTKEQLAKVLDVSGGTSFVLEETGLAEADLIAGAEGLALLI